MSLISRLLAPGGPGLHYLEERDPTRVALALDSGALREEARATAALLRQAGVAPAQRVVLALPNGPDLVAWLLGALWCGALPVVLPAPEGEEARARLESLLPACRPVACVLPEGVGAGKVRHTFAPGARGEPAKAGRPVAERRAPLAFLQYTAGSTGAPKGVAVTRRGLAANLEGIGHAVQVRNDDRVYSWLPLFHDMGLVGALLFSLWWRLPLFLATPRAFVMRPSSWLRGISAHRATLSPAPHFAYALCAERLRDADLQGLSLDCWRLALDGAEPVRAASAEAFVRRFASVGLRPGAYAPVYGMAEATLALTLPPPGRGLKVDRVRTAPLARGVAAPALPGDEATSVVCVGRPLPGHRLQVRASSTGVLLPERQVGELWVQGPSLSRGYWGARGVRVRRGALRTGDLGYLADGELYLVGRLKDLIIAGGANLHPEELERAAEGVPGVGTGRCVAFGVPGGGTERPTLLVEVRRPGQRPQLVREVADAVRAQTGVSAAVLLVPPRALPRTPSGKRKRQAARALFLEGAWATKMQQSC